MTALPRLALPGGELVVERGRPLVMGVVNAGPDSFSDSVRLGTVEAQLEHALALVAGGADMIDVGAESGVTYSAASDADVEAGRVVPLVERLVAAGVLVSVDTWKAPVAQAAVDAGAAIVNDVSGLADPGLADVAARSGAGLVLMHTRAEPKSEHFPDYRGAVADDVQRFLRERIEFAVGRGVSFEQLIVDPGPDFAKAPRDSVEALRALPALHELGRPILLAVSRKYFVGAITGRGPAERLAGTLAAMLHGVAAGAAIVRVHDVAAAADALAVWRVLEGLDELPGFDAGDESLKWIRA